jgi:DNA-3-methyladenine glycosylase I
MSSEKKRCHWCNGDPLYEDYHDNEWGVPNFDDQSLFEFLLLEGAQAGLSWITILRKRESIKKAFSQFSAENIARYGPAKIERLMLNKGIIRNRLKIESTVTNAMSYLQIQESVGSFSDYVWQFVDGEPLQNRFRTSEQVPATTTVSEQMSKTLRRDGFRFVGPTICYAFMQATGMVNDHMVGCYRHDICRELGASRL